jgi:hypothetical protein
MKASKNGKSVKRQERSAMEGPGHKGDLDFIFVVTINGFFPLRSEKGFLF